MLSTICLWWLGVKVSAPIWYYILLVVGITFRFIDAVKTTNERKKIRHL